MAVRPFDDSALSIDIMDVVAELRRRGAAFPAVLRFQDVLRARVQRLNLAFNEAIREAGYKNDYRAVYPIKVNQLHEVVEEVLDAGKPFALGLECGSKAELVATVAHLESDDTLLICNGVKDRAMLSLILSSQSLGKNVIPVMEKYAEFNDLIALADESGVTTQFGIRVRLRTAGSGKWADSGGYQSKFGISLPELLKIVETLKENKAEHRLTSAPFSPRQPDFPDHAAQTGRQRTGADLCGTGQAGFADPLYRRGRRTWRELHRRIRGGRHPVQPAGIRQRRGFGDQGRLRRARGATPDPDLRKRPRHDRAPLGAGSRNTRRLSERQR